MYALNVTNTCPLNGILHCWHYNKTKSQNKCQGQEHTKSEKELIFNKKNKKQKQANPDTADTRYWVKGVGYHLSSCPPPPSISTPSTFQPNFSFDRDRAVNSLQRKTAGCLEGTHIPHGHVTCSGGVMVGHQLTYSTAQSVFWDCTVRSNT